ncbi:MAG: hypothetical protein RSE19_06525 [Myroides sp.]
MNDFNFGETLKNIAKQQLENASKMEDPIEAKKMVELAILCLSSDINLKSANIQLATAQLSFKQSKEISEKK